MFWNAAGLRRRVPFLRYLLQDNSVDIALINETHLLPSHAVNLPGYHVLRLDASADNPWRGLIVAVRRNIVHHQLPDQGTQSLDSLGVEAHTGTQAIRAFAVNHPGTSRLKTSDIHRLLDSATPTLAAGDWNTKHPAWGCTSPCTTGRRLFEDAYRHGYGVTGPEEPTHYSHTSAHQPSTIDLVVHRGLDNLNLETHPDAFGSDHKPVLATLTGRLTLAKPLPAGRRICWEHYEAALDAQRFPITEPITTAAGIDMLEAKLSSTIRSAMEEASLPASPRRLPPLPARVRTLVERKRRIRSDWQRSRDPLLKTQLNSLIEQIREALMDSAAESWDNRIAEAREDQASLNRLCRQLTKKKPVTHPLLHPDGTLRYTAEERAEILADHLASVCRPNPSERPALHARIKGSVTRSLRSPSLPLPAPPFLSPQQVR